MSLRKKIFDQWGIRSMNRWIAIGLPACLLGVAVGAAWVEHFGQLPNPTTPAWAVQPGAVPSEIVATIPLGETADAAESLTGEEQANIRVYARTNPSVVNIDTRSVEIDQFFMTQRESEGTGSGAILDSAGHILTNFHVVDGASQIEITLASNKSYPAQMVGADAEHDVAVLKIEAPSEELTPITLGSSQHLQVGQRVYVLGNPFGWDGTLTTGIVSSLNRNLPSRVPGRVMQSLIQTDAAMNPGNSGGPMLNTSGQMIGMCVAIATKTGQNAGVGFAIPIDRIKNIVPELIQNGRLIRGDLGITHVMETDAGLVVARLDPEGPAAQAGLQGFRRVVSRRQQGPVVYETQTIDRSHADLIVAVNGEAMHSGAQFRDKILEYKPGEVVRLTIMRGSKQLEVDIQLGSD